MSDIGTNGQAQSGFGKLESVAGWQAGLTNPACQTWQKGHSAVVTESYVAMVQATAGG